MSTLLELGADVGSTDCDAAAAARAQGRADRGRLAELVEWLAATQGRCPPAGPRRVRCVVAGTVTDRVAELAAVLDVGVRELTVPADAATAFTAGAAGADDEVERGTDLTVLAAGDGGTAAAVAVGLLTGAEPVALLPRGAQATDTPAWIERATQLRDTRRRIGRLRNRPDDLLAALDSPVLAACAGFALRAIARRTPVVLDGSTAVAAALLCADIQAQAGLWWQVADGSPDPVHRRAVEHLQLRPLLDLGTAAGDGAAGLLTIPILRAAVGLGRA